MLPFHWLWDLIRRCKGHWPLLIVLVAAVVLLFADLGREYLWADEGDTAVFASRIVQTGLPDAWDGVTLIDSDMGARLNNDLIMVAHPWVQYYVTAVSFLFFGETAFAARFPFAVAGWLTVLLIYCLVFRLTNNRRAAFSGAILLLLSIQFLLYARQSRNYSLNMFFTCLLLLRFFHLTSGRGCIWFVITAVLLFHTHPIAVATFGALGLLTLFYRPFFVFRKWFWISMIPVSLCTVPWLFLAQTGLDHNTTLLRDIRLFVPRLGQFAVECASVTPLIGVAVLFSVLAFLARREVPRKSSSQGRNKKQQEATPGWNLDSGERTLVLLVAAITLCVTILSVMTQSRPEMWSIGMRYASPLLPLIFAVTGFLISKLSGANRKLWVFLLLIFLFTKVGRITPWSFGEKKVMLEADDVIALHVPENAVDRLFRTGHIGFLKELWLPNPGTVAWICEFLNANARRDEILITNYEWEPIYFHTRLPQGLKLVPESPIGQAARRRGLPDYVFGLDKVRWIVWRSPWEQYNGYFLDPIIEQLLAEGAKIEKVATIPETVWENRENIHFYRFPGEGYKFPWFKNVGDVQVFRVEWQEKRVVARD